MKAVRRFLLLTVAAAILGGVGAPAAHAGEAACPNNPDRTYTFVDGHPEINDSLVVCSLPQP
jgi:hypothetical protein